MNKIKTICTVGLLTISMLMSVGCNKSDSSSSTVESSSITSSSLSESGSTKTTVAYKNYRLIINDSLTKKPLDQQFTDNNGFIPDDLYKTSIDIKAYADKNGNMIIAENTSDKLTGLNNITKHNDDFTSVTIEGNNTLEVKTALTENNELYVVMGDNVAAYELDSDNRNGSIDNTESTIDSSSDSSK